MKKSTLSVLRSGNFLLYYHDNGSCTLYSGKKEKEENIIEEFDSGYSEGYAPPEVIALCQALKGKVDSI